MDLGSRIRAERTRARLSQDDIARAIGSTKQAIYKYEAGIVTNIPMDKIEKMAEIFGVTPSYLMGWEEKKPAPEDELSDNVKMLVEFARSVPDEKAELVLKLMRAIVEGDL